MFSLRIKIGIYLVVAVLVLLVLRLWQLQVLDGEKYKRMSEENRLRIVRTTAPRGIIYDRNGVPLVKNIPMFSVSITPDAQKRVDTQALADLIGISRSELDEKLGSKDNSPFVPVKLKQGLSFAEVAKIEASRSDFPGLFIETDIGREYPYGKVGAHVLGYLGKVSPEQLKKPEFKRIPPDMFIGQWGVEAIFDEKLRGIPGERIIEVDALGRELRFIQQTPPVRGDDMTLSIDISIQNAVADAFGEKAGALVALRPDTGEILALESYPSFDPNVFSRGVTPEQWNALINDPKKPMLNRALQSQYPPGSTFKIITAVAAMEEGVIDPNTKIYCTGGLSYGKWTFGCWRKGGHGVVDFHRGIVESCDVYFYEVGKRLGIDKIFKYAKALGLGTETGVKLVRERAGLIPDAEWKRRNRGLPWYLGDTFMSAIGQGFVSATPIQMAVMTSTFANGGRLFRPTLLKGEGAETSRLTLSEKTRELVTSALADVVNAPNGTARRAHSDLALVGGKTGTAQVASKGKGSGERFMDHAWFVAFAPVEHPEIALSVFVEHGGGGGAVAAPIAKKALDGYFTNKASMASSTPPEEGQVTGSVHRQD
ncbi:MAG: penicillin-binding protein 2 [Chloroflexota bacterium]